MTILSASFLTAIEFHRVPERMRENFVLKVSELNSYSSSPGALIILYPCYIFDKGIKLTSAGGKKKSGALCAISRNSCGFQESETSFCSSLSKSVTRTFSFKIRISICTSCTRPRSSFFRGNFYSLRRRLSTRVGIDRSTSSLNFSHFFIERTRSPTIIPAA